MFRLKTASSVKKRFKITKTGKILRKKAFKSHILEKKTSTKKHRLSLAVVCKKGDCQAVKLLLPYI